MKVVLLQEVQGLGGPGTVKDVANGYARNYLLPRGLATPATRGALKQVEQAQAAEARKQAKLDQQYAALAGRINGAEVHFRVRASEEGRLFGSVTNSDIAEVLSRHIGEEIDRRRVMLETPIHTLGTFPVTVRLSAGNTPTVSVVVESESAAVATAPTPAAAPAPAPVAEIPAPAVEPVVEASTAEAAPSAEPSSEATAAEASPMEDSEPVAVNAVSLPAEQAPQEPETTA